MPLYIFEFGDCITVNYSLFKDFAYFYYLSLGLGIGGNILTYYSYLFYSNKIEKMISEIGCSLIMIGFGLIHPVVLIICT